MVRAPLVALADRAGVRAASGPGGAVEESALVQTVVRVGITSRLEARVDAGPLLHLIGDNATGFGDLAIGLKLRLIDTPDGSRRPSFGVQPFFKPPIARSPFGTEQMDFGGALLAGFPISDAVSIDFNVSVAALGLAGGDFLAHVNSQLALNVSLTSRFSLFFEVFGASPDSRDGTFLGGLNIGAIYLVHPRIALDLNVQGSSSGFSFDPAVRTGVSFLVGP